jgi:hypothetical protein
MSASTSSSRVRPTLSAPARWARSSSWCLERGEHRAGDE